MAKLSARGRTEIARFKRTAVYHDEFTGTDREYVVKVALMSDGNILRNNGGGWKTWRKIRKGIADAEWISAMENHSSNWERISR